MKSLPNATLGRQQLIWHFWASGKKAGKSATSKVTVRNSSSSKSWEEHLQKQQQQLLQMSTIIATSTPQLLYHAHQIFKKAKTAAAAFESPRVTRLPLGDASLSKKSTQSTITKSQMRERGGSLLKNGYHHHQQHQDLWLSKWRSRLKGEGRTKRNKGSPNGQPWQNCQMSSQQQQPSSLRRRLAGCPLSFSPSVCVGSNL